jgi:hypothetical protein
MLGEGAVPVKIEKSDTDSARQRKNRELGFETFNIDGMVFHMCSP